MINLENPGSVAPQKTALFQLGFRPFFLLASLYAVVAIALWTGLYFGKFSFPQPDTLTASYWHAHEMIYGYALAVIAGFLLTAVKNWTGLQTLHGKGLLLLVLLWLSARPLPFIAASWVMFLKLLLETSFILWLSWELFKPVARVKQWKQMGILAKVFLMLLGNLLYYSGFFGLLENGIRWGLYSGLYIVLSLVLVMGRRVIPFFIEKGVDYDVKLTNHNWVDWSSLVLMLLLWITDVFLPISEIVFASSLLLFVIHAYRMFGWHTRGIWRKPLLWVLYLAYGWIVTGFALKALSAYGWFNPMLALHAFAYGGIGMVTIGMMARVAYGHTGRDVFNPPEMLYWIFLLLMAGSIFRVILPVFWPSMYLQWIMISQLMWIASFSIFLIAYIPIFIKPRIDGRPG